MAHGVVVTQRTLTPLSQVRILVGQPVEFTQLIGCDPFKKQLIYISCFFVLYNFL